MISIRTLGLWMPLCSDNLDVACEDLSQPEPEPLHSSFQKDGPSFILLSFLDLSTSCLMLLETPQKLAKATG